MRLRLFACIAFALALTTGTSALAHVGSPDILFEGKAGPYNLLVSIQPPDVVPGIARISVRADGGDISRVTVQPIYFRTGGEGAPRPDEAERVQGDPRFFEGKLWLMEFGSSSVRVRAEGISGSGEVIVPVPAVATARRGIDVKLGLLLGCLGLFLFAGAVAVVGVCAREAILPPGSTVTPDDRGRARKIMLIAVALIAIAIIFGGKWWRFVDSRYLEHMYKPIGLSATVGAEGSGRALRLVMSNTEWLDRQSGDLIPDHGKLMHLFLVREPSLDSFAHLHPIRSDADAFEVTLPPIPEGHYRIYADVVHKNGLIETLTAEADVPPLSGTQQSQASTYNSADPDDSWLAHGNGSQAEQRLADGSTMTWERDANAPLIAERLESLRFFVKTPDGGPSVLEPYMGMLGHAVVMRKDGAVFVHVHPVGTVSMASQQAFTERVSAAGPDKGAGDVNLADGDKDAGSDSGEMSGMRHWSQRGGTDHSAHTGGRGPSERAAGDSGGIVSFPYLFPKPGDYRIWVQVKRDGRVLTGVYDVNVL
ncbi:MAG TPA: hypothetical protein VF762_24750 [Blastocatellia bacterium]|jgi:hypothetical protein